jgi:hypothetical protein
MANGGGGGGMSGINRWGYFFVIFLKRILALSKKTFRAG